MNVLPPGVGAATVPPQQVTGPALEAQQQLAIIATTLTAALTNAATPDMIRAALLATNTCAEDIFALQNSQIPPGTWVSGGVALGGAVGVGLLGGIAGWMFGKREKR